MRPGIGLTFTILVAVATNTNPTAPYLQIVNCMNPCRSELVSACWRLQREAFGWWDARLSFHHCERRRHKRIRKVAVAISLSRRLERPQVGAFAEDSEASPGGVCASLILGLPTCKEPPARKYLRYFLSIFCLAMDTHVAICAGSSILGRSLCILACAIAPDTW